MANGPDQPHTYDPLDPGTFRFRATLFLMVAAILLGVVTLAARMQAPDDADLAIALVGVLPVYAAMLAAAWGMRESFAWGETAAIGIMWVFVVEGAVSTLVACVALPAPRVDIPLLGIGAALVLWTSAGSRDRRDLSEGQQGCAAVLIVLAVLGVVWPYVMSQALSGR
jgi:FtsH-binding integral membrane protein